VEDEITYEDLIYKKFNESLDVIGEIDIAGYQFYPSYLLYNVDNGVTYHEAYLEFKEREFEELKDAIYGQYPSCIAYNFRLSEKGEGASDPVRKLLHLKDTWESIIFVLYALVLGEIRNKSINISTAQVFVSYGTDGLPVYGNFNNSRLINSALKTKIQCIKAIINFSKLNGLNLKCEVIEEELLDKLLELQDIRNDISHHTAPTREEAEEELRLVIPLFQEMLMFTKFLEECKILRFESFATKCKCEEFKGHHLNKEFDDFDFEGKVGIVLGFGQEQLFVQWDAELFSLSPFLHFHKDDVGRETYISFFKERQEGMHRFEPITKRHDFVYDHLQERFDEEQAHLLSLIMP
jgi:hypothetical protein